MILHKILKNMSAPLSNYKFKFLEARVYFIRWHFKAMTWTVIIIDYYSFWTSQIMIPYLKLCIYNIDRVSQNSENEQIYRGKRIKIYVSTKSHCLHKCVILKVLRRSTLFLVIEWECLLFLKKLIPSTQYFKILAVQACSIWRFVSNQ